MGVSRPTFTRIYAHARQKVAKAFVEGRKFLLKAEKFISTAIGIIVKHAVATLTIRKEKQRLKIALYVVSGTSEDLIIIIH
jgi:hypothetical protein